MKRGLAVLMELCPVYINPRYASGAYLAGINATLKFSSAKLVVLQTLRPVPIPAAVDVSLACTLLDKVYLCVPEMI